MARVYSDQTVEGGARKHPIDEHGKLRFAYFSYTATVALADGDSVVLCNIPKGRVRVLPWLSRISTSAWGASRTLDVGFTEYASAEGAANEVEDIDALVDGMDVSAAVNAAAFSTVLKWDLYSRAGLHLVGKVLGGTLPIAGTLKGFVAYIYE